MKQKQDRYMDGREQEKRNAIGRGAVKKRLRRNRNW